MSRGGRGLLAGIGKTALGLLAGLAVACGSEPNEIVEPVPPAPASPQATVILEPPRIEIGETAILEIAVSVPSGSRVTALPVPEEPPGVWVLEAEPPRIEKLPGRDVHTTRFRVRGRETGSFVWPAHELTVIDPEGREQLLSIPARPFRVASVVNELREQQTFFSYRVPSTLEPAAEGGALLPGLIGALLAWASLGLLLFVRRVRRARVAEPPPPEPSPVPWQAAQSTFAAAAEIAESDPIRAADMASAALRVYTDRRFASHTRTATTPQLRAEEAPWVLTTRWGPLLDVLERLDELRFRPLESDLEARRDEVRRAIDDARSFYLDSPTRSDPP
jgi:hypothetical protein